MSRATEPWRGAARRGHLGSEGAISPGPVLLSLVLEASRGQLIPRISLLLAVLLSLTAAPCAAQNGDASALERRLTGSVGLERLRALAQLTEAYRSTDPRRAVELGDEAISLAGSVDDPQAHVTALNESAWALMELGRYDEAMARAREGATVAERAGLRRGLARAYNNQGVIHRHLGDFRDAIDRFRQALAIYEELGDAPAVATSLNNISVVLGFDLGHYGRALETQLEALRIRDQLGISDARYQSYNTLGVLYHNLRDHPRALEYLGRALSGWRELELPPRIAATLDNLAAVYTDTGDLDLALDAQTEALALREALSSRSGVAFSEQSIGIILTKMGRLAEARVHLERALETREELGERKNMAASLVSLAALDRLTGRVASAEERALRAATLAAELDALEVEQSAYLELSRAREGHGDFRGALEAFRRWDMIKDSLFTAEGAQRIGALDAEFQADLAQQEIDRLRAEADLAESVAQRRGAQLVAAVLLGLVVILLYGYRMASGLQRDLEREVEQRTAELREANRRLEELSLTDSLTGLRNRRYLFQTVEADLAVSLRAYRDAERIGTVPEASDVVFYLLDLDDFKSVNDEHGHAAGDRVLAQVAGVLEETGRASDVVVRWGGEEFLIMSRGVDRAGAAVFAERVRNAIREHLFMADDGVTLRRTCSVGFAAYPFVPRHPRAITWEQVVELADQGAYIAKRSGRDAWVGVYATEETPLELGRGEGLTVAPLAAEGALALVTSLNAEGRRTILAEGFPISRFEA